MIGKWSPRPDYRWIHIMRERAEQQQSGTYADMARDLERQNELLAERLREAEARAEEWLHKNAKQAECIALLKETLHKSQRIEKEGIQAIASASAAEKRLAALEEAARPFVEYWKKCDEADAYPWALTPEDWKRLEEVLAKGN